VPRAVAAAIDVSRTALVGHSRGGEAVTLAPAALAATPIDGVTIRSVFAIAPVDRHDAAVEEAALAVLLPACDGDVVGLDGMNIYDRSLAAAPATRAQVMMVGANHNFFNDEWKRSDNDGVICDAEIGAAAQRGMLETTAGAWLAATLDPAQGPLEPFLRAEADTPAGIAAWAGAPLDLRWSYSAPERLPIDAFEGDSSPDQNLLGEPNAFAAFETARRCFETECDSRFHHDKGAMLLTWDGGAPVARWELGELDATGASAISLRVVSRRSTFNDGFDEQSFWVRVVDADGGLAEVLAPELARIPHLYPTNYAREILQTIRLPLADITALNPDLDVAALAAIELEMDAPGHPRGSVLVTDLELAE
jgi:hypothetical protein